jgi:hypothetical protein
MEKKKNAHKNEHKIKEMDGNSLQQIIIFASVSAWSCRGREIMRC